MTSAQFWRSMYRGARRFHTPAEFRYLKTSCKEEQKLFQELDAYLPDSLKKLREEYRELYSRFRTVSAESEKIKISKAMHSTRERMKAEGFKLEKEYPDGVFGSAYLQKIGEIYKFYSEKKLDQWLAWLFKPLIKHLQLTREQVQEVFQDSLLAAIRNFDCNFKNIKGKCISFKHVLEKRFGYELSKQAKDSNVSTTMPEPTEVNLDSVAGLGTSLFDLVRGEELSRWEMLIAQAKEERVTQESPLSKQDWALLFRRYVGKETLGDLARATTMSVSGIDTKLKRVLRLARNYLQSNDFQIGYN